MATTRLTFYAGSLPHFTDWLAPLWKALPDDYRAAYYARGRSAARAIELGVEVTTGVPRRAELVVVASYEDYRAAAPSPVVLVNHGAGQRYSGDSKSADHPSYSGGKDRDRVVLYLCPSHSDAEVNRLAYPDAKSVAVGPFKLDPFLPAKHRSISPDPVIAISAHADVHVCPETRWAFPHFREAIIDLAKSGNYTILGHGHPRFRTWMMKFWGRLKVEYTERFEDVLERASCYVIDNSSTAYEAAAVGIPVVCLNAPWYRRDVHHGLRFWSAIPGIEVDDPRFLEQAIQVALDDPITLKEKRAKAVQVAYSNLVDGRATERAVKALMELADAGL